MPAEVSPNDFGDDENPLGGEGRWLVTVSGKRFLPGRALTLLHDLAGWSPYPAELAGLAPRAVPVARTDSTEAADRLAEALEEAELHSEVHPVGDDCVVELAGPLNKRQLERALRRLRWVPGLEEGADLEGDYPVSDVPLADDYPRLVAQAMVAVLHGFRTQAVAYAADGSDEDAPDESDESDELDAPGSDTPENQEPLTLDEALGDQVDAELVVQVETLSTLRRQDEIDDDELVAMLSELGERHG